MVSLSRVKDSFILRKKKKEANVKKILLVQFFSIVEVLVKI